MPLMTYMEKKLLISPLNEYLAVKSLSFVLQTVNLACTKAEAND